MLGIVMSGFLVAVFALLVLWPDNPGSAALVLLAALAHLWWAFRWQRDRRRYAGMPPSRRRFFVVLCWFPALFALALLGG